jgi:hypothetical protein
MNNKRISAPHLALLLTVLSPTLHAAAPYTLEPAVFAADGVTNGHRYAWLVRSVLRRMRARCRVLPCLCN